MLFDTIKRKKNEKKKVFEEWREESLEIYRLQM